MAGIIVQESRSLYGTIKEEYSMKINHFDVSMAKSMLRGFGYVALIFSITVGVIILIGSEFLGIVEELVDDR